MRSVLPHKRAAQIGMTLVEVMVAMVLTAILLVGMNALWVEITREVDALVLRQKAIFRLNGEMERLVGWYVNVSGPGPDQIPSSVPVTNYNTTGAPTNRGDYIGATEAVPGANVMWENETATSGMRLIYPPKDPSSAPWMGDNSVIGERFDDALGSGAEKLTYGASGDHSFDTIYGRTFYWDAGTPATGDDRNIVWIDREKSIVAQVSWSSAKSKSTYRCYDNASQCRHITLYLDYPFRYSSETSPKEEIPGFPINTITLQTIVSRRP